MIRLVNGRGQLGTVLKEKIKNIECFEDIWVYHTWNVDDKSEKAQSKEFNKFVNFVNQNKKEKIVFISTTSQKDNWYNYYKHMSESFLLLNADNCVIVRIPALIGKGMFVKLKMEKVHPYGFFNLMSIEEAAEMILEKICLKTKVKFFNIAGERISAKNVQNLILFGKKYEK